MEATAPAAGWFDDPHGTERLRWWDGTQWTDHVADKPAAQQQAEPAVAAVPAAVPVAAPVPAAASAPAAAMPAVTTTSTTTAASSRRVSPSPRTMMIAGGAVALVLGLLFGVPMLVGGDAPATKSGAGAQAAAPTGAPLTTAEYVTQVKAVMSGADSMSIDEDTTPDQLRAAAENLRSTSAQFGALVPPASIAVEHQTLATQFNQLADGVDKLATNPKDEAAGMAMFGSMMGTAATMAAIETKLGVKIEDDSAEGASPAA